MNASLLPLLRERRIRHLIMEATPDFWSQSLGFSREGAAWLLHDVAAFGYTMTSRPLTKADACRRVSPLSASQCWLWKPKEVRQYVLRMREAEDLYFERIKPPGRAGRGQGNDAGQAVPVAEGARAAVSDCEAHSFWLGQRRRSLLSAVANAETTNAPQ